MGTIKHTIIDTDLGWIAIAVTDAGLKRISIHDSSDAAGHAIEMHCPESTYSPVGFGDLAERIKRYAHGERVTFGDKLDFGQATSFQHAVWKATREIPYGETRSYEWIACRIGKPNAARAVGQALSRNPFPIVVPCHRVIGADGKLTGYRWGVERKRALLARENPASYPADRHK
jgi:O-6-methylguanine DNA methyltransferase